MVRQREQIFLAEELHIRNTEGPRWQKITMEHQISDCLIRSQLMNAKFGGKLSGEDICIFQNITLKIYANYCGAFSGHHSALRQLLQGIVLDLHGVKHIRCQGERTFKDHMGLD
jgi:hypothetical protein